MKKIITLLIAFTMIFTLCACGSVSDSGDTGSDEGQAIKTEKKILNVEVTLPAEFAEDTTQESLDELVADGSVKSATLNEDGSVTYVMTKKQHSEMMESIREGFRDNLNDMIGSEELSSVTDIKVNDDFTEFEIYTTSQELSLMESFMVFGFYMMGGYYNSFAGTPIDDVLVTYYNSDTGEIIDTMSYKDTEASLDDSDASSE